MRENPAKSSRTLIKGLFALILLLFSACTQTIEVKPFIPPVFPPPPDPPRFIWERAITSTADIRPNTNEDRWRRALTGEKTVGEALGKPYGVAVYKGRVFIGDAASRIVIALDFPNNRYFRIGDEDGPGLLGKPLGIAVDAQGTLYVVDSTAKNLKIYDSKGQYVITIGEKGDFIRPTGVAVNPEGSRVFIVDTGGVQTRKHRVRVYDPRTGEHLFDIGSRGSGDGEFNLPNNATIGHDGNLYVTDAGNFRVQVFTSDGKFVKTIGEIGRQWGMFSRPKGIATDTKNNLYVVDSAFGNFQVFNDKGDILLFVGKRGKGGPAEYFLPAGIAVDENGRVLMVDQFYQKVDVYRPANLDPETGYLAISRK